MTDNEIEDMGFAMLPNTAHGDFMKFAREILAAKPVVRKDLQSDLHDDIMRISCVTPDYSDVNCKHHYRIGHRDARHAAAELALMEQSVEQAGALSDVQKTLLSNAADVLDIVEYSGNIAEGVRAIIAASQPVALPNGDDHVLTRDELATYWKMAYDEGVSAGFAQGVAPVQTAPEGWKLVPIKPTREMERAASNGKGISTVKNMESYSIIYADMLAAAPVPGAAE